MTASSGGRGITGMFESPRRRRRLKWGAALLVAAGVVGLGVVLMPDNNGMKLPAARPGKPTIVAPAPKHVRMGAADQAAAKLAAARFISTAVLRRNVDQSWALAAPELRFTLSSLELCRWLTSAPLAAPDAPHFKLDGAEVSAAT